MDFLQHHIAILREPSSRGNVTVVHTLSDVQSSLHKLTSRLPHCRCYRILLVLPPSRRSPRLHLDLVRQQLQQRIQQLQGETKLGERQAPKTEFDLALRAAVDATKEFFYGFGDHAGLKERMALDPSKLLEKSFSDMERFFPRVRKKAQHYEDYVEELAKAAVPKETTLLKLRKLAEKLDVEEQLEEEDDEAEKMTEEDLAMKKLSDDDAISRILKVAQATRCYVFGLKRPGVGTVSAACVPTTRAPRRLRRDSWGSPTNSRGQMISSNMALRW